MYYVYILHSQKDHQLYTGYTNDLQRRFQEHQSGKVTSTMHRLPVDVIYYEAYTHEEDVKGREIFLKSGSGKRYLEKQLKHYFQNNIWMKE